MAMNIRQFLFLLTGAIVLQPARAQHGTLFELYKRQKQALHKEYYHSKQREFAEYRKKKNAEFAKYLGQPWEEVPKHAPIPVPKKPDPVKPVIVPKNETVPQHIPPVSIPIKDILAPVQPVKEKPLDIPVPPKESSPGEHTINVSLFGMPTVIALGQAEAFKLSGVKERDLTRAWQKLSTDTYAPIFESCARLCKDMKLNGWATYNLCKAVAERLMGKGTNEAVVLQTYLMTQLGYDARMMRKGNNRLCMICPANVEICQIMYTTIRGKRYYIWDKEDNNLTLYSYKDNFANGTRAIDFQDASAMRLAYQPTAPRTFKSEWNKAASASVSVNRILMNYYRDMPLIADWSFYARQPMEREVSRQLIPVLQNSIKGRSEQEAANILLRFVQTAFSYETDSQQFGREKTNFKEELFYYKACDCEDRSILFADLVSVLLNLDVVLLYYPNHLCTAVKFSEPVNGDFVSVNHTKYTICDPTYINASIGRCMPKFRSVQARVYKINP